MNTRPRQFLPGLLTADTLQKAIDSRTVNNAQPGNGPLAGLTNNYSLNLVNFDWVTWHDYEWDNWVTVDALIFAAIGFLNLKGIWRANTAYNAGESVFDPDDITQIYLCNTPHTSGTDFNVDKPLYWDLRTDVTAPVSSVFGRIGDVVAVSTDYVAFYPLRSEVYTKVEADAITDALDSDITDNANDIAALEVEQTSQDAAITANANAISTLNTNIPLTYMPFTGGTFTGQVNMDTGAANQFEVRRDAASRIRWMSGDGSKNGMWQEYTQSAGSGRFRFYDAAGSTFFNMDMTADGDLRMNGTRWNNTVTPDVTSLLTKGRADALYIAATTGQRIIRFVEDHSTLGLTSFNDLAVDNDPDWPNQQYMIRIGSSAAPTDGFPGVGAGDFIQSHNWGGATAFQMGFNAAGNDADAIMYIRRKSSGVWSRWYALDPTDTLLLTGSDDLDTIDIGGTGKRQTYRISGVPANGFPNIGSGDWLEFYQYSATAAVQRGIDYNTGMMYTRSKISGVWGEWRNVTASTGMTDFSGDDLNDAVPAFDQTQEIFRITAFATLNNPINLANGDFIIATQHSVGVIRQLAHQWNPTGGQSPMYYRDLVSGVWSAWQVLGGGGSGAAITSGDAFPSTPLADAMHFKTSYPVGLYIYLDDGDSSQWVQADAGVGPVSKAWWDMPVWNRNEYITNVSTMPITIVHGLNGGSAITVTIEITNSADGPNPSAVVPLPSLYDATGQPPSCQTFELPPGATAQHTATGASTRTLKYYGPVDAIEVST